MFWATSAGPTTLQLWNPFESGDRILRTEPAKAPAPWKELKQPVVCNRTDAERLTLFLNQYYKGEDWTLHLSVEKVQSIISMSIVLLAVREGEIVGCILSRPLGGTLQGLTTPHPFVQVIEGLCVRSDLRGQHLAGWLIGWIDFYTSQHRPNILIWYRELPVAPSSWTSTAMQVESYSYVKTKLVLLDTSIMVQVPFEIWSPIWKQSTLDCVYSDGILDSEDLLCFSPIELTTPTLLSMVLVVNTHRRTTTGGSVWEVLWCSSTNSYKRLNGVAFQLEAIGKGGVLFATDANERGKVVKGWPSPWVCGSAGVHCTYFYNYIPSKRPLSLVALRGCI